MAFESGTLKARALRRASTNNKIATLFLAVLLVMTSMTVAHAATLSGTIYTEDLDIARYSLLLVESSPPQRIILPNGTYNIELSPGIYTVRAQYSMRGRQYDDHTTLNITHNGTFTYDFILFPTQGYSDEELPDIENITTDITQEGDNAGSTTMRTTLAMLAILAMAIIVAALLLRRRRAKDSAGKTGKPKRRTAKAHNAASAVDRTPQVEPTPVAQAPPIVEELPVELQSIIAVLKNEDGRATQKELRRHIPCSEAKMSMMLTELEHKGRIERIKKGRGNIIILKR